jgi:uncharacterized protein YgiM (DUF1202 family)
MHLIAKFILSIEKLLKNPISWLDKQPWILRMFFSLAIVPLISAASIFSYQKIMPKYFAELGTNQNIQPADQTELLQTLEKYHDSQIQEILYLREEIVALKKILQTTNNLPSDVLGEQTETIENNLETLVDPDIELVFIKSISDGGVLYTQPSTSSKKITDFDLGMFYPVLDKKDNWYQIDLGNNTSAWVEQKNVVSLPEHENN